MKETKRKIGFRHITLLSAMTRELDNYASKKTCEYAGGELLEIAKLPKDSDMRERERRRSVFLDLRSLDTLKKITEGALYAIQIYENTRKRVILDNEVPQRDFWHVLAFDNGWYYGQGR